MCFLICKPKGVSVPADILHYGLQANRDGFGVAWTRDGEMLRQRTLTPEEPGVLALLTSLREVPALIHFRYLTHGARTVANIHPFYLREGSAVFAHNGILPVPQVGAKSDSRTFVRHFLDQLPPLWWKNEILAAAVDAAVGPDRAAVLDTSGHFTRFGGAWTPEHGCHFSHAGYRAPARALVAGTPLTLLKDDSTDDETDSLLCWDCSREFNEDYVPRPGRCCVCGTDILDADTDTPPATYTLEEDESWHAVMRAARVTD